MEKSLLDMTVREVFAECGIGPDDMSDAVEALGGQLTLFGSVGKPRRYVDSFDQVVFVAGIRGTGLWAVFAHGVDGEVKMLKLPPQGSMSDAQGALDAYARKKGWATVPKVESVHEALILVMERAPSLSVIFSWSEAERVAVANWAVSAHLRANDNAVRVPHVPNALFDYLRSIAAEAQGGGV
jgi:hypothetical protein